VELVQVDAFDAEPAQAVLALVADRLGPQAVAVRLARGVEPRLAALREEESTSSPARYGSTARPTTSSECP
jgi:hypothetical protein